MNDLKIVKEFSQPGAIRSKSGVLVMFPKIQKWPGKEDRYLEEIEEQWKLAEYLLECLKKYN